MKDQVEVAGIPGCIEVDVLDVMATFDQDMVRRPHRAQDVIVCLLAVTYFAPFSRTHGTSAIWIASSPGSWRARRRMARSASVRGSVWVWRRSRGYLRDSIRRMARS